MMPTLSTSRIETMAPRCSFISMVGKSQSIDPRHTHFDIYIHPSISTHLPLVRLEHPPYVLGQEDVEAEHFGHRHALRAQLLEVDLPQQLHVHGWNSG
jgi:hypothetical protein